MILNSKPIRVAVVGTGGWGSTHVDNWKALRDRGMVDFVAACDAKDESLSPLRNQGISCFSTLGEMLERTRPDAVSIATGIASHRPIVESALRSGVAVLCEKPAAPTVADVDAMISARDKTGNDAFIAFQVLYTKEVREIKELVLSGKYGKLLSADSVGASYRDDAYYARNSWAGMRFMADGSPVYDSPFANAYAHYANLALFLAGSELESSSVPTGVEGGIWKWRTNIDNFDTCSLRFSTKEGIPVTARFSHAVTANVPTVVTLELEDATVRWTYTGWRLLSKIGDVLREENGEDAQHQMFRSFVNRLSKGSFDNLSCSLECAREHARAVEMVQEKLEIQTLQCREAADALFA